MRPPVEITDRALEEVKNIWSKNNHSFGSSEGFQKIYFDSRIEAKDYKLLYSHTLNNTCASRFLTLKYRAYSTFLTRDLDIFQETVHVLNKDYKDREGTYHLNDLFEKYNARKTKSPIKAAMLSALLPGMGKVYTRRYRDAIFAFIMTTVSSYQSYRGFDQKGSKSFIGWAYGGLGLGLYIGGIFGAHKSARIYNDKLEKGYNEILLNYPR